MYFFSQLHLSTPRSFSFSVLDHLPFFVARFRGFFLGQLFDSVLPPPLLPENPARLGQPFPPTFRIWFPFYGPRTLFSYDKLFFPATAPPSKATRPAILTAPILCAHCFSSCFAVFYPSVFRSFASPSSKHRIIGYWFLH